MSDCLNFSRIWTDFCNNLSECLSAVIITDSHGVCLSLEKGLQCCLDLLANARKGCNEIFITGNGASASMASHYAADMTKNAGLCARAFTNTALITAISNDISYERVFAEAILLYAKKNDILIAISSSGNSLNIIAAIQEARKKGMEVITFTGMQRSNACHRLGDINFYVPADTYGLAETAHAALLHYFTDALAESWKKLLTSEDKIE